MQHLAGGSIIFEGTQLCHKTTISILFFSMKAAQSLCGNGTGSKVCFVKELEHKIIIQSEINLHQKPNQGQTSSQTDVLPIQTS